MEYTKLANPDIVLIQPKVFEDLRGFFMETFRADDFNQNVLCDRKGTPKTQSAVTTFVQENHIKSIKGTLRGLHYQIKQAQGKLVRVIKGRVFDVVVDIRKSSPFFGKWTAAILSAENKNMLWIPPGFAHGIYVLSPEAEFTYKCTAYYAPEHARSIVWNDPAIDIGWPIIPGSTPILSDNDRNGAFLDTAEVFA